MHRVSFFMDSALTLQTLHWKGQQSFKAILARICNIYPDAFKPCLLFPKPTSSWSESLSLASFKA